MHNVYVEMTDGKFIELFIYGESHTDENKMKLSLFHLFSQVKSCHQKDVSDILNIWYQPVYYDFKPYSLAGFEKRILPRLVVTVRSRFLQAMRAKETDPELSLIDPDTGALLWEL